MYFKNNYLNVIHVLQCTENILFNTVPVIKESLQKSADLTNLKVHVSYIWQLTFKYRIWSKRAIPPLPLPLPHTHPPHAHTQCHTCNFLWVYYTHTCMKSWGQEQQTNTLNPHQILINTHMTALLKRKSLGSKVPLDLSVDQFYINSIMRVWTLKAGMQSLSWLHIVFPLQE